MQNNNFAITAMGRSGTMFLSQMLNRSTTWTVLHEPLGSHLDRMNNIKKTNLRFAKNNYGEVNSRLRWVLASIHVTCKAVVIRNPYDMLMSAWNRHNKDCSHIYSAIYEAFELLDRYIEFGIPFFYFEKMTTHVGYLQNIAKFVGITDLKICRADLEQKVNRNPKYHCEDWSLLPQDVHKWAYVNLRWFYEKYYEKQL